MSEAEVVCSTDMERKMRDLMGRGLAVIALVVVPLAAISAHAAEMPVKTKRAVPPPPPPPEPVYNWSGCYVGGYGGVAWNGGVTTTDLGNGAFAYNDGIGNHWTYDFKDRAMGGGTVGCNWVAAPALVIGVEAEGLFQAAGPGSKPAQSVARPCFEHPGRRLAAASARASAGMSMPAGSKPARSA
jgi:hypothetical protein